MAAPDPAAARRRLRATFDAAAQRYDEARPRYPAAVVDDLVARAGLGPGGRVLEIGCGTGQLTVALAARGLDVTAVELGPALAAVARRNLEPHPRARVVVGAFEEYRPAEPVDAVVAATSFHWIAPDERVPRAVAALRPGGALAVVDVRHVAGASDAFFADVQPCYRLVDPATPPDFRLPEVDEVPPAQPELDTDPLLTGVTRRRHTWEVDYSSRGYRTLLSTYSPQLDRPADLTEAFLDCVAARADAHGGTVTMRYLAEVTVARRR